MRRCSRQNVRVARTKKPATTGDMIRTLLVIVVPVALIIIFFSRTLPDYPVQEVDWRPVLAEARKNAPYPVLAPEGLPDTWRATKAVWVAKGEPHLNGDASVRNLWELGFLDPHDVYLSLHQGDARPELFVDDVTRQGYADGQSAVGGQTWVRYISPDERTRSLVLTSPKVTTIVVGDTTYEALEAFAGTLTAG